MPTIYAEATPLSVALFNVKELMPKANKVPYLALIVRQDSITAVGSFDHMLIASDTAPLIRTEGWGAFDSHTLLVTLDDLTAMEKGCREAAKDTQASLKWDSGCITLTVEHLDKVTGDKHPVVIEATNHSTAENEHHLNTYYALLEMLAAKADRPYRHALSRGFFSKFDKVKTSSKDHPLSLAIPDEYSPWLVKCGPTFVGMVAPVLEEKYEENHGPEGLW